MVLKNNNAVPADGLLSLDRLPTELPAVISRVDATHDEAERMKAMGVCEGRPIHTVRAGSRMVICAAGVRIGLDRRLAETIFVTPVPGGMPCQG